MLWVMMVSQPVWAVLHLQGDSFLAGLVVIRGPVAEGGRLTVSSVREAQLRILKVIPAHSCTNEAGLLLHSSSRNGEHGHDWPSALR